MTKKIRKPKVPEQSISSKVNYYKSINRSLRKRIDNLEKRMVTVEHKMGKYKKLLEVECIKPKQEKNTKEDFRKKFNKEFNPSYKEEE